MNYDLRSSGEIFCGSRGAFPNYASIAEMRDETPDSVRSSRRPRNRCKWRRKIGERSRSARRRRPATWRRGAETSRRGSARSARRTRRLSRTLCGTPLLARRFADSHALRSGLTLWPRRSSTARCRSRLLRRDLSTSTGRAPSTVAQARLLDEFTIVQHGGELPVPTPYA